MTYAGSNRHGKSSGARPVLTLESPTGIPYDPWVSPQGLESTELSRRGFRTPDKPSPAETLGGRPTILFVLCEASDRWTRSTTRERFDCSAHHITSRRPSRRSLRQVPKGAARLIAPRRLRVQPQSFEASAQGRIRGAQLPSGARSGTCPPTSRARTRSGYTRMRLQQSGRLHRAVPQRAEPPRLR